MFNKKLHGQLMWEFNEPAIVINHKYAAVTFFKRVCNMKYDFIHTHTHTHKRRSTYQRFTYISYLLHHTAYIYIYYTHTPQTCQEELLQN